MRRIATVVMSSGRLQLVQDQWRNSNDEWRNKSEWQGSNRAARVRGERFGVRSRARD